MAISPARTIAFDVLKRVATQDSYADDVLRAELRNTERRDDAGLATELSQGVLRWQRLLDFAIDRHVTGNAKSLDPEVRIALRMGVYQLYFLTRVPVHAAVHESVELVKRARKRSAAPMVNAILRKLAKTVEGASRSSQSLAETVPPSLPAAERLGIVYSHPSWLVARWLTNRGEVETIALLQANNRVSVTSCHLNEEARRDEARTSLEKAGCAVAPGVLLKDAWSWLGGNPAASDAVQHGWVSIQDEASQAVAHVLDVKPGDAVLDLCAAPGGKTQLLASAAGSSGQVIATDLHSHRVRAMEERFLRASLSNVKIETVDGTKPLPFGRPFDHILVDAPCTGTGTLARHPEIRWRLRIEDLADLHQRQVALLRNALGNLAPGGRLVYSTCSLEPEENEDVVAEAMASASGSFKLVAPLDVLRRIVRDDVPADGLLDAQGCFRSSPDKTGTDGFFAAVMEHALKRG